jgi:hypothetical protein
MADDMTQLLGLCPVTAFCGNFGKLRELEVRAGTAEVFCFEMRGA